jgi:PAS domain S-box-containing protein
MTKNEFLLREELRYEFSMSWFRIAIGVGMAALFIVEFILGNTSRPSFIIQIAVTAGLLLYSIGCLLVCKKGKGALIISYAITLLDVTIVTGVLWSCAINEMTPPLIINALFGAYFIAIIFTVLHRRALLPVFCGACAAIEYSMLHYFFLMPAGALFLDMGHLLHIVLLMLAAVLSGVISLNNLKAIQKTILSEMRYQNLIERLPDMLFTLNEKGRFIWANKAAENILGFKAEALVNRDLREFLTNPDELKLRGELFRHTIRIKDASNELKFVDAIIRRVREEKGPPIWEGSMTDVTEREIALFQREEMASRLYQYQKMESLGTLASGMAHDFNNVLQTISDLVENVQSETQEQETKGKMALLLESLADAKFMTSELLALGRRNPLDYKSINLRNFFTTIIPHFQQQLGSRYTIAANLSDEKMTIQGDSDYLKRIFQNFIGNARDAMHHGGTMTIECFPVREEGQAPAIAIRFTDEGGGISPEIMDKIFDPFFTTKKPGKGTGLGLALVQRIVSLHNGTVSVEKTGKQGTTFRIEIPESEMETEELDTKHIMQNRVSTTVLLLDDDNKIREILRIFMKGLGYTSIEASNADEAAEALSKHVQDCEVVIMDWRLGADDPHQVIQRLRAIKENIVIFVVSGYSPKRKSIEQMKIEKWFTKPYEKNVLDIEIQKAVYKLRRQK